MKGLFLLVHDHHHVNDQRRIIVDDSLPDVGAHEEVSSEASSSRPCTSMSFSRSSSYGSILSEIGPLQAALQAAYFFCAKLPFFILFFDLKVFKNE